MILLTKSSLPVSAIATMFDVTRAAIYGVRDRRSLPVHKGSPALMAGIRRLHNKTRRAKVAKTAQVETPHIPATPVPAAPVLAPTPEAVPSTMRPIAVEV